MQISDKSDVLCVIVMFLSDAKDGEHVIIPYPGLSDIASRRVDFSKYSAAEFTKDGWIKIGVGKLPNLITEYKITLESWIAHRAFLRKGEELNGEKFYQRGGNAMP